MKLPHAVIIAGGKGERLGGVRKATLRVGGARMVDRVAQALGLVEPPLMISTGPGDNWLAPPADSITFPDLEAPTGGPLAGLAAAIESLCIRGITNGLLASVAVDTPFLDADFIATMGDRLDDAPAAYAGWGDQFYPPNAIWRIEALTSLPDQVLGGDAPHSLKALQQVMKAHLVDWTSRSGTNPFANVNTIDDLIALGRLA